MSKLVTTVLEAPQAILQLKKTGEKLLRHGLRGHKRFKKVQKIVYPYEELDISRLHRSVLYENHRRFDLSRQIQDAVGEFTEADAIHPMLVQQGLTLLGTAEVAEKGIFVNVPTYSRVMLDFVRPLELMVDLKPTQNWKMAIERPLVSFAQPYANTVALGITQHINTDFRSAFALQMRRQEIVSPEDWINSWAVVLGVTGDTVPWFREVSGNNSWSATGSFLRNKYAGALVKSTRDIPYIQYARKKNINIDGLLRGYSGLPEVLMKDPDGKMLQAIMDHIEKMKFQAMLRELYSGTRL